MQSYPSEVSKTCLTDFVAENIQAVVQKVAEKREESERYHLRTGGATERVALA